MEATISIINYNYGRFLSDAIESALNQNTHINYEVLLIDDGSTDNSDEIVTKYLVHDNFRVSKSVNQGFGKSLTRAIKEAKGNFVFLLDADDYYSSYKIEAVMPFLQRNFLYVCDTSQYVDVNRCEINGCAFGSTSTIAVNKEAVLNLLPVENELSFFSLYKLGRGKILDEKLTYYRLHGNSMTNRTVAGKWQTYLAGITHNLSNKLTELAANNITELWKVSKNDILKVAYYFRSQAYYNELEANLELNRRWSSFTKYKKMIFWGFRYKKQITLFQVKMFFRTVLMKPSFPKKA